MENAVAFLKGGFVFKFELRTGKKNSLPIGRF
jgi:hypothetical protein